MRRIILSVISCALMVFTFTNAIVAQKKKMPPYQPSWNSFSNMDTPKWLREGKFGIYTHWGVCSVPAQGPNGTLNPHSKISV